MPTSMHEMRTTQAYHIHIHRQNTSTYNKITRIQKRLPDYTDLYINTEYNNQSSANTASSAKNRRQPNNVLDECCCCDVTYEAPLRQLQDDRDGGGTTR